MILWPISDRFLKQKYYASLCITVQRVLPKIVSDKLSKLDSKVSDIWNYFRTMSDGRRQTESLRPNALLGLIWVQTVCKGYQQTIFFQNQLFRKILSGIPKYQKVWIQIRPDILSGLILVQTVCKGNKHFFQNQLF